jgi:hypothetical protein
MIINDGRILKIKDTVLLFWLVLSSIFLVTGCHKEKSKFEREFEQRQANFEKRVDAFKKDFDRVFNEHNQRMNNFNNNFYAARQRLRDANN